MPRVSIVIATYNWSEALACALRSVALQTFQDYEVLVVGDACTDESESVVKAMNDPRFRWFNREKNAGSQWAPNNDGIAQSSAEYIAYLGHDDLWYSTHLESLVRVADAQRADIACAIAVMYGPEETGVRAISGVFTDGVMDERQFVVPSSMLHRRVLTERIGPWRDPSTLMIPTDCDLVLRAVRAVAKFAATDELTVFKFNAAWRRDAYGRRATHEQRAMLARIESGVDFRKDELVGVVRAILSGRHFEVRMPLANAGTREAMLRTREFKGVAARAVQQPATFSVPRTYSLDDQPGSLEWYGLEQSERFGSFRWSGPSTVSTLRFPVVVARGTVVTIAVLAGASPSRLDGLTLEINGRATPFTIVPRAEIVRVIRAEIEQDGEPGRPLSIQFRVTRTTPEPTDNDRRPRGLAVCTVTLTPPRG
ncbi:MAG: glycosyltransferase family 2 protein [Phycisphaerales bacterium]